MASGSPSIGVTMKSGLNVTVTKGSFNINGVFGYLDADETVNVPITSANKHARVCLRLNDDISERKVSIVVKVGATLPEVTKTTDVYELCLANILASNESNITNADIEDTRLDEELCGVVGTAIKSIDTTTLYNQIKADLTSFKNNEKAMFLEWFEQLKGIFNESVAGNIQTQIDDLSTRIDGVQPLIDAIPRIYKGTSSTPPSNWKDGDIYVMYE